MRSVKIIFLLSAGIALVSAAATQPKVVIQSRQLGMKQVGQNFKTINDQVRSGSPEAALIKASTGRLAALAAKVPSWFPAGTGPDTGIKTGAKREIWTRAAKFRSEAAAFAAATRNLAAAAAKSNDPGVLEPQIRRVGGTCKSCHTAFKVPS